MQSTLMHNNITKANNFAKKIYLLAFIFSFR